MPIDRDRDLERELHEERQRRQVDRYVNFLAGVGARSPTGQVLEREVAELECALRLAVERIDAYRRISVSWRMLLATCNFSCVAGPSGRCRPSAGSDHPRGSPSSRFPGPNPDQLAQLRFLIRTAPRLRA